jgi:hypothetical protein
MVVLRMEKQQVIGSLKATGSTDPDVLFAKKEEMLIGSRRMKFLPTLTCVVRRATSVTIHTHQLVADAGLLEYVKCLTDQAAVA